LAGARDAVTRDELYVNLHARLATPGRLLSPVERECLMHAAAAARAVDLPFELRPGLVAEMIRFYDQLRRQSQSVKRFEELMREALGGGDGIDRGADRLLRQTHFLAESFRAYERAVEAASALDEHLLRARLLAGPLSPPLQHVVVTVSDWIADPGGLFLADFDLLSRLSDLSAIDLVCTEGVLESGFHERLHGWWPGLDEVDGAAIVDLGAVVRPVLSPAPGTPPDQPWLTYRDREEELLAVAQCIAADRRSGSASPVERMAVVFKRPLPYLYLAPRALTGSGIPFQSSESFPLAAEPMAAVVDLVLDCVETSFTRTALVALLRSPYLRFTDESTDEATRLWAGSISALDRALSDARYLGDLERLEGLPATQAEDGAMSSHAAALKVALEAARQLAPLGQTASASTQIHRLRRFLERHESPVSSGREARARAAIMDALGAVSEAHGRFHDPDWTIADLASSVRRWIGEQTFAPEGAAAGIHLVDDQAARYGEYDDVTLVGLIENEWPERRPSNIFYPAALLKTLGWPSERDRRSASDARFVDLLRLATHRVTLSTFTLEDESLVMRSMQLDEVPRARLSVVPLDRTDLEPAHADDLLVGAEPDLAATSVATRSWLELRTGRSDPALPVYHGAAGTQAPRAWSVSALETYLDCPFKFFARHVLRLKEEPDDEQMMDPRRQGQLVHEVFEAFFRDWQASGQSAITPHNLDDARRLFGEVVDQRLASVSKAEAGLERTRLFGSSAAAGLGEAVFRMEAERSADVVERLLEHRLDGEFVIRTEQGERRVALRGKADRLDLLDDGTFRLIDYKLGWPPNRARALQLPIYGLCAEQALAGRRGRRWVLGEAVYLAFKGPRRVVPLFAAPDDKEPVLAAAQQRLSDTIDAIERGDFPPAPDDVFRCETCHFSSVCRKDYVGDV
jgi:RecB family exonuclease